MRISSVRGTYCFVARGDQLAQVVRVVVADAPSAAEAEVALAGDGLRLDRALAGVAGRRSGPAAPTARPGRPARDAGLAAPARFTAAPGLPDGVVVEVPVIFDPALAPGRAVTLRAVARLGRGPGRGRGRGGGAGTGLAHVDGPPLPLRPGVVEHPGRLHLWLGRAGLGPGPAGDLSAQRAWPWSRPTWNGRGSTLLYKVVFAEVDYLKPFWDLYPDRRQELRDLIAAGRVEIVGGTYNEPNTNLTGAETGIRAAVYGLGFQRDVMGADPQSAWQLDVFGHDPQFPGIMAECRAHLLGLGPGRSTSGAQGLHREHGVDAVPLRVRMGRPQRPGPAHQLHAHPLLGRLGARTGHHAGGGHVAGVRAARRPGPGGGDQGHPPARGHRLHPAQPLGHRRGARLGARRYAWPRFEVAIARDFFDAVRSELARQGRAPSPQTRDMNPVYTGKDVSFIDTKQAQRLAEAELADAEMLAALAAALGAPVPRRELDKAWRQLVFNAHHDGITGSESDQVYLDLLGGWREAYELADRVTDRAGRSPGRRHRHRQHRQHQRTRHQRRQWRQ